MPRRPKLQEMYWALDQLPGPSPCLSLPMVLKTAKIMGAVIGFMRFFCSKF